MSSLLERAKAHHENQPRRELLVPEWGEGATPARITWTAITVADQDRIYAPGADGRIASGGTVRIRTVLYKACDEAGRRLFDEMSEHDLRHNVSGDIVGRIANAILYSAGIVDRSGNSVPIDEQLDAAKNG